LGVVTVMGAFMRLRGWTSLGMWRDDAWVVLSSRVGIGTAWHMWATAPGFSFVERSFVALRPGSTRWAQVIPLTVGIAAVPAVYGLARLYELSRRAALVLATAVCISPVCVMYSSHVKEYGTDLLLSCLLLGLTELARRRRTSRSVVTLGAASVLTFATSASVGPEIVACWIALVVAGGTRQHLVTRVLPPAAGAALGCGAVAELFYRHISPALSQFWSGFYLVHSAFGAFWASVIGSFWRVNDGLFDLPVRSTTFNDIVGLALAALLLFGVTKSPAMRAPALTVLSAFVVSGLKVAPLGTGRTDEYLYPALLLLFGAGCSRLLSVRSWSVARPAQVLAWTVVAGLAVVLMVNAYVTAPGYPAENVVGLAALVRHDELPGDHIFVSELMRYPWALYEDRKPDIVLGSEWSAGFTVLSTAPNTFIVPSEYYEGDSQPARWAQEMSAYPRLWYVETGPFSFNPSYGALLNDGWQPVLTLTVTGCEAILLER
jgi:hypothetical protein